MPAWLILWDYLEDPQRWWLRKEVLCKLHFSVPWEKVERSPCLLQVETWVHQWSQSNTAYLPCYLRPPWLERSAVVSWAVFSHPIRVNQHKPQQALSWLRGDKSASAACPRPAPQASGDVPPGELAGRPDRRESAWQKTSSSFLPLHVWHLTKTAVWLPRGASTYALMKTFHLVFQAFWCFKQLHILRTGVTFPRCSISHNPTHENLFLTPLKSHSLLYQRVSNIRIGPISIKNFTSCVKEDSCNFKT